jgi:hypothetical protein
VQTITFTRACLRAVFVLFLWLRCKRRRTAADGQLLSGELPHPLRGGLQEAFEVLQRVVGGRVLGGSAVVSWHKVVVAAERFELHPETGCRIAMSEPAHSQCCLLIQLLYCNLKLTCYVPYQTRLVP